MQEEQIADVGAQQRWPQSRGECFVSLTLRDPDWAFAAWEVTPEAYEGGLEALRLFGARARLSLRLYGVPERRDEEEGLVESYDVSDWLGSRYVMLTKPGAVHSVAIGLEMEGGEVFHALARSRWVEAPRVLPASGERRGTLSGLRGEEGGA